jgi:KDO2-lipid IV(A) lauroyltransferase
MAVWAAMPLVLWRALGLVLGVLLWCLAWPRRRVVWINLALCFAQVPVWRRAWWSVVVMVHFAQTWLDRVWLWHGSPALLRRRIQLHGQAATTGALVWFAPHFMGLDAGWTALTLNQPGGRLATIYAPQRMAWLNRWMAAGRSRFGRPCLFAKRGQLPDVVRWLREGGALYLLPDLDVGGRDAVFVDFMGVSTATATVLPRLAKLSGAVVQPVLTTLSWRGYQVQLLPPINGDDLADPAQATQRMNHTIAQWARQYPTQYWWVHKRFKTRPAGMPNPYH